jgi:putative acetyltransferase
MGHLIRPARSSDHPAIAELLDAAFAGTDEAGLVERLRAGGHDEIELVAEEQGQILGHILFSAMQAPFRALALAPLAVAPARQRQGTGAALVHAGHRLAREDGWQGIFVLGDPAYYRRFGYSPEAAKPFSSRYSGPAFMLLPLDPALPTPGGAVHHAAAFTALG